MCGEEQQAVRSPACRDADDAEQVGTRPSVNWEPPEGGGSQPKLNPASYYESNSSKLRHVVTAAATPCGVLVRTSMYVHGHLLRRGSEQKRAVLDAEAPALYSHRAGANVSMRQRGSRVARGRARTVLSRLIAAVRAWATAASANATLPIATRIEHHASQDLVSEDPKLGVRRGRQTKLLSSIVAVDHWIFRFLSWSHGGIFQGRQHLLASEAQTVEPTSALEAF